jgi:hypothetical protein
LHLQAQRGQGRAQLVRGVGGEVACSCRHAASSRASRPFISATSGATSAGRPATGRGARSPAARAASWRRRRSTGATARPTTHHTMSISMGASSATGSTARSASWPAMRRRALCACAIWITCVAVSSVYTR